MVISFTAPPIIRDAVAISVMSDREGAKKAYTGRRRSRILRQRFECNGVDREALFVRSALVCFGQDTDRVSLDGRSCAQVQVRTLTMHIPSPLTIAQTTSTSLHADSCYFGRTKKSRAVSQPSAPSAVVARQHMQPDPPMHLEANGDTSRAVGGAPLRASTQYQGDGSTVCGVGVHITAAAMCDGGLVPETCCCFVKSACARYLSCERDDAYCDMKLSKRVADVTCR
jgi:hypothetical protein